MIENEYHFLLVIHMHLK